MTIDDLNALYSLLQAIFLGTNKEADAARAEWDKRVRAGGEGVRTLMEVVRQTYVVGVAHGMANVMGATEEQRAAIREWLSHEGWDAFCADTSAWPRSR